jgi:predicted enzyme related to lactoylglutathione lyase
MPITYGLVHMKTNSNAVGWFEIPTIEMDRAVKFYETILGYELQRNKIGNLDMALFPAAESGLGASGSLVCHKDHYKPSAEGVLIYLTSPSGNISVELGRIDQAGGKLLMAKTLISEEIGFMGLFLDSEGNRIALHSRK